jgi:hypothetical protein
MSLDMLEGRYTHTRVRHQIVGVQAFGTATDAGGTSRCHQPARWRGRSIHWYHTEEEVLGYVLGGGYWVPVAAMSQLVRCTQMRPCTSHSRSSLRT